MPKFDKPIVRYALVILTVSLFACGDDDDTVTDTSPADTSVADTSEDTSAADTEVVDTSTVDTGSPPATAVVDPTLFLVDGLATAITEVECMLSDGSTAQCYSITTNSVPSDHESGPWCPTQITDGPEAGGIWPEGGVAHDVDGAFVENLATFYDDPAWEMYNADGSINFTETAEECAAAARPDVDPELQNHCVQCLPEYVETDLQITFVIPKEPSLAATPQDIRGNMGVAFNGVEFAAAAPTDAILGAYTLAPFDDCGGHINLNAGYHYHAITSDCLTEVAQDDGHAPLIGYAMDGFGIYAMLDADGEEPDDLDGCRGHTDGVRGYHYHVSGAGENMIIGCHAGLTVQSGRPPRP